MEDGFARKKGPIKAYLLLRLATLCNENGCGLAWEHDA